MDNYSSSKASAELIFSCTLIVILKNKDYLSTVSARAGNVIGGGDMKINRIVPDIMKSLFNNESLILRNPKATRPLAACARAIKWIFIVRSQNFT